MITGSAQISRGQYVGWIADQWPDKKKVAHVLLDSMDTLTRGWPPCPSSVFDRLLVEFGMNIENAEKPEDCFNAFLKVLNYMSCPEPGWDGVDFKVAA